MNMESMNFRDRWTFCDDYDCWCLEDLVYTPVPLVPECQRLSIFVPRALRRSDGTIPEAARRVSVVFENNAGGYMQMPNVWLGEPRCYARQYLEHGLIYVSAGCRGSNSRSAGGDPVGKAPATLVDLKTAIRFLRHHRAELPGDWDRIISCGWSAGGAMSCLLAVTGDNARFLPYLAENGAFPEESDAVFAAQIYCPIIDLEHADLAYEWMFREDRDGFTPFQTALSDALSRHYTAYFNALALRDPENGDLLTLTPDGRGGSGCGDGNDPGGVPGRIGPVAGCLDCRERRRPGRAGGALQSPYFPRHRGAEQPGETLSHPGRHL